MVFGIVGYYRWLMIFCCIFSFVVHLVSSQVPSLLFDSAEIQPGSGSGSASSDIFGASSDFLATTNDLTGGNGIIAGNDGIAGVDYLPDASTTDDSTGNSDYLSDNIFSLDPLNLDDSNIPPPPLKDFEMAGKPFFHDKGGSCSSSPGFQRARIRIRRASDDGIGTDDTVCSDPNADHSASVVVPDDLFTQLSRQYWCSETALPGFANIPVCRAPGGLVFASRSHEYELVDFVPVDFGFRIISRCKISEDFFFFGIRMELTVRFASLSKTP